MNKPPQCTAGEVRDLISKTELHLARLKEELAKIETAEEEDIKREKNQQHVNEADAAAATTTTEVLSGEWRWPLSAQEYDRYGRQLILPNVGIHGALLLVWLCCLE